MRIPTNPAARLREVAERRNGHGLANSRSEATGSPQPEINRMRAADHGRETLTILRRKALQHQ